MTPWKRRGLRVVQLSPLLITLALVGLWFSVPAPLATRMMRSLDTPAYTGYLRNNRTTIAQEYYEKRDRERASREWADVRFREVARQSWTTLPAEHAEAELNEQLKPFALADDPSALTQLREFVRDNPGVEVDAWVFPRPKMPEAEAEMLGVEELLPGMAEFVATDTRSVYEYAWHMTQSEDPYPRFERALWQPQTVGRRRNALAWWVPEIRNGDLHLTMVLASPTGQGPDKKDVARMHEIAGKNRRGNPCMACHPAESALPEDDEDAYLPPIALWETGPVRVQPIPQFTTRDRNSEPLDVVTLASLLGGVGRQRWTTVVWAGDTEADAIHGQPTMLFTATFPADPHAEYVAWTRSRPGRLWLLARARFAGLLPNLIIGGLGLLGLSLVASPAAFAVERRLTARELALQELERVRRDAHDRIYNRLAALAKRVEGLDGSGDGPATPIAEDLRGAVSDLQTILRDASGEVQDGETPLVPVAEQLAAIARAQQARYRIDVRFSADDVPPVPGPLGWDLQCVLEEAITNAARHGEARLVSASLRAEDGRLRLRVEDDGAGFGGDDGAGFGEQPGPRSTGLRGMRARLGRWGGTVELHCTGSGALLQAELPLP